MKILYMYTTDLSTDIHNYNCYVLINANTNFILEMAGYLNIYNASGKGKYYLQVIYFDGLYTVIIEYNGPEFTRTKLFSGTSNCSDHDGKFLYHLVAALHGQSNSPNARVIIDMFYQAAKLNYGGN